MGAGGRPLWYDDAVQDVTERLVRRYRDDPSAMSRNRHFHTFTELVARRARRIARHLRDLEAAVLREPARAEEQDGCVVVRVTCSKVRATRVAYLTRNEYALLVEDPRVAARLA